MPSPILRFIAVLLAGLVSLGAIAADDTLVRVAQTRRIVLGVHDNTPPVGYLTADGKLVGYHMDICMRVVKAIQRHLDLSDLAVATAPSLMTTRLALLNNRTTDIDCTSNPVQASAMSHALFSHAISIVELRLGASVDRPELRLDQLDGRNVGVVAGGAIGPLRAMARLQGAKMKETPGKSGAEHFALLVDGRVDMLMLPATYFMAFRAMSPDPSRWRLLDGVIRSFPLALMLRLEDEALLALVNGVLADMMKTGEMARLWDKWYRQPIPGLAKPLDLPLPDTLKTWFAQPGLDKSTL